MIIIFYERFKYLCRRNSISESKAAESVGLNRSTVSRWRDGAIPTEETISKICSLFNVPVEFFDDSVRYDAEFGTLAFRERLQAIIDKISIADSVSASIDMDQLKRIANGDEPITFDLACSVADAIGCSLDYLAGLSENDELAFESEPIQKHLTLYCQLSEDERALLDAQISGILQAR